jgi:hypothetical protein
VFEQFMTHPKPFRHPLKRLRRLLAIDSQLAKRDALNDRRESAMKSFVDMDAMERSMAT